MLVGRFSSIETAMRADVVPWHVAMDEEVRTGLVDFLEEEPRKKNKQRSYDASLPRSSGSEGTARGWQS